jgi:hypothetical protein
MDDELSYTTDTILLVLSVPSLPPLSEAEAKTVKQGSIKSKAIKQESILLLFFIFSLLLVKGFGFFAKRVKFTYYYVNFSFG